MDRIQAKEKINKLLRLANDKGATSSERDTALEMAKKLATKYGFKIQKGAPSTSNQNNAGPATLNKHRYEFDLNCFNKKFVNFLFDGLGIKNWFWYGKKTISFDDYRNFNVDEFKKFYKKFVSVYYKLKKEVGRGLTEVEYFDTFCYYFTKGAVNGVNSNEYYAKAYELGHQFANIKFI